MKLPKLETHRTKPIPNPLSKLSVTVLLFFAVNFSLKAATFQVALSGTLYYTAGDRWDSVIQVGTPFSMSLTHSTPPPASYNFSGYSTYVYPSPTAAMSFRVGTNMFSAGDIQLTVWNNSGYDGYLLATYAGSSPGFDHVEFNAALQSSDLGLLTNTDLPIESFPLATFDKQALTSLIVEFSGYPGEWNYLGGSITAFSVTEVPEPSTGFLIVSSLAGLLWASSKRK